MPSVLVVPVYVEIPSGIERAVMALESHLRRAGYVFRTGEPVQMNYECINPATGANRPSAPFTRDYSPARNSVRPGPEAPRPLPSGLMQINPNPPASISAWVEWPTR